MMLSGDEMKTGWILGIAALLLVAGALYLICRRFFIMALARDGKFTADVTEEFKTQLEENHALIERGKALYDTLPYEALTVTSFDGLRLSARFYKNGDGRHVLLLSHGFRSSGRGDFAAVFPLYYDKLGYSLLVIDHRAHGASEGKYISYGISERFDIRDWTRLLTARADGDVRIVLDGISMGATAVMMACGVDLPPTVAGVIADSGFNSPWDIFCHILHGTFHLGSFPLLYILDAAARLRAHFGFRETSAVEAMRNCRLPVLFVHGTADTFVPPAMTEATYAACASADKTLLVVEGAMHGCSYLRDRARCEAAICHFLSKTLDGQAHA